VLLCRVVFCARSRTSACTRAHGSSSLHAPAVLSFCTQVCCRYRVVVLFVCAVPAGTTAELITRLGWLNSYVLHKALSMRGGKAEESEAAVGAAVPGSANAAVNTTSKGATAGGGFVAITDFGSSAPAPTVSGDAGGADGAPPLPSGFAVVNTDSGGNNASGIGDNSDDDDIDGVPLDDDEEDIDGVPLDGTFTLSRRGRCCPSFS
jgi:hypothetical protein